MRSLLRYLPILALAAPGLARGQEFTIYPSWLVEPVAGTFYEQGVGAPTVGYDPASDTWVMIFEAMIGPRTTACGGGQWGLGYATSPDGISWTVAPDPLIEPSPGSWYGCAVAHPVLIVDDGVWKVWFKAEQEDGVCDDGAPAPAWGCGKQTGVGYMFNDGGGWQVSQEPVLNVSGFGFPAVTKVGGTWHMLLAKVPELYLATSPNETDWALEATPVLPPGYTPWTKDRVFNPAVVCEGVSTRHPFTVFLGGKDMDDQGQLPLRSGWGMSVSGDARTWFVGAKGAFEWAGNLAWRHWDAVRMGDDDYLIYFTQQDDQGRNRVGLAYTTADWDESALSNRICP